MFNSIEMPSGWESVNKVPGMFACLSLSLLTIKSSAKLIEGGLCDQLLQPVLFMCVCVHRVCARTGVSHVILSLVDRGTALYRYVVCNYHILSRNGSVE